MTKQEMLYQGSRKEKIENAVAIAASIVVVVAFTVWFFVLLTN